MKIEVLFPEVCNLFGDISNIKYLKKCIPEAEIIETSLEDELYFANNDDVNMIYIGAMPEDIQELAIKKLLPYKERIQKLIEKNILFLATGNALEIFGNFIENEDESKITGLELFDLYAKRKMMKRHNSIFVGEFEDTKVVGYKSQFTMAYGKNDDKYFAKAKVGIGLNEKSNLEGIKVNNFIGTYLLRTNISTKPLFY